MDSGIKFEGMKELREALGHISKDLQLRAARSAVGSAAGVVRKEAKRVAKAQNLEMSGALLENIAIKRRKELLPSQITYEVMVRHGKKAKRAKKVVSRNRRGIVNKFTVSYENDPFYWFMHEFGTSKMPARPFMRPAFEAKKQEALDVMAARIRKNIEMYKKKYGL